MNSFYQCSWERHLHFSGARNVSLFKIIFLITVPRAILYSSDPDYNTTIVQLYINCQSFQTVLPYNTAIPFPMLLLHQHLLLGLPELSAESVMKVLVDSNRVSKQIKVPSSQLDRQRDDQGCLQWPLKIQAFSSAFLCPQHFSHHLLTPCCAYSAVLITCWGPASVICFDLKSMLTNTMQRRTRTLLK